MFGRDETWPGIALHPGEHLEIDMEEYGVSMAELVERTGIPEETWRDLCDAKIDVNEELAHALGSIKELRTFGGLWLAYQEGYEHDKAIIEARAKAVPELGELARFPYRAAADNGWITAHRHRRDRVRALWRFFGVDTLRGFAPDPAAQFRFSGHPVYSPMALAMWLRKGELDAADADVADYDKQAFIQALADIKLMTRRSPAAFLPLIRERCAQAGVAFMVVEQLPSSGAKSVARWREDGTPWIQINLQEDWQDSFWWTFYLEASHVLEGRGDGREVVRFGSELQNGIAMDGLNGRAGDEAGQAVGHEVDHEVDDDAGITRGMNGATRSEDEALDDERAVRAAKDWLLLGEWDVITRVKRYTYDHVRESADEFAIHPGIIVNRLQAEGLIPHSHLNKVRERMAPAPAPRNRA